MKLLFQIFCIFFVFEIVQGIKVPTIKLSDGNEMPMVGFGTFLMKDKVVEDAMTAALENGYRLFDTAFVYENEEGIGKALKKWFHKGNKRKDIFITSKLPPQAMRASDVPQILEKSMNALGIDYIDMYLIHIPPGICRKSDFNELIDGNGSLVFDYSTDIIAVWKELEKQVRLGKIKSIGLSNFNKTQILRIWDHAEIKPTNLEIEINPYIQQNELVELCNELGIVVTAYSPLGSAGTVRLRRKREASIGILQLLENPVVNDIAQKHNKTAAQIVLRYNYKRNIVAIPKSKHPNRIKRNIQIFDFKLDDDDIKKLKSLDMHGEYRKFDFLTLKGIERHPEYPFTYRIRK